MGRVLFKKLSADYLVKNKYIKGTEEDNHSVFSCIYHLNAIYDDVNDYYNYTINRSHVLIDDKPVRKLMDRIICEIGDSLYPISLAVTSRMQILDVNNYEDIKKRWADCTKKFLKKYPSFQMARYVKMAEKNISDKERFINSLYRDTFFNVYFRDIYTPTANDETCPILWTNFPKREMNQTYLYEISPMKESRINTSGNVLRIVPEQEGEYVMGYDLGKKGEILGITGHIASKHGNRLYTKQISVKSENIII